MQSRAFLSQLLVTGDESGFFMLFYKGTLFVVKTYFRQHIYFLAWIL